MNKFKAGDKVVVVRVSKPHYWYADKIGEVFTITGESMSLSDKVDYLIKERPTSTLSEKDIELCTKNTENTITTEDAILHLQSLVDLTGDDVEIIIRENDLFVKAFGKQFYCENADVLEEAAKAAAFLSRQEIV